MSKKAMCMVVVWRGWNVDNKCGKPAKGKLHGGMDACGIHLNAERKREANERERAAKRDAADAIVASSRELVDRLALVGVNANAIHSGGVRLTHEDALLLIARLGGVMGGRK